MRLPRDLSGDELAAKLGDLGYLPSRQTGSHLRLTRAAPQGAAHVTVPRHRNLRLRTAHLRTLATPALVVQGERDPFGTRAEVAAYDLAPTLRDRLAPRRRPLLGAAQGERADGGGEPGGGGGGGVGVVGGAVSGGA